LLKSQEESEWQIILIDVFRTKGQGLESKRLSGQEAQKAPDKEKAPQSPRAEGRLEVMSVPSKDRIVRLSERPRPEGRENHSKAAEADSR